MSIHIPLNIFITALIIEKTKTTALQKAGFFVKGCFLFIKYIYKTLCDFKYDFTATYCLLL